MWMCPIQMRNQSSHTSPPCMMSCPEYQMFRMVSKPMWVLCFLTIGFIFLRDNDKKRLKVELNLDLCLCLWFRSWNCVGRSIMSWSPCCCNGSDTISSSLRKESSPQAMRRLRWVDLRPHTFTTKSSIIVMSIKQRLDLFAPFHSFSGPVASVSEV